MTGDPVYPTNRGEGVLFFDGDIALATSSRTLGEATPATSLPLPLWLWWLRSFCLVLVDLLTSWLSVTFFDSGRSSVCNCFCFVLVERLGFSSCSTSTAFCLVLVDLEAGFSLSSEEMELVSLSCVLLDLEDVSSSCDETEEGAFCLVLVDLDGGLSS